MYSLCPYLKFSNPISPHTYNSLSSLCSFHFFPLLSLPSFQNDKGSFLKAIWNLLSHLVLPAHDGCFQGQDLLQQMLSVKCETETIPNHLQKCMLMIMQGSALGYILCNTFWDRFQIYKQESEITPHELLSLCNNNFWLISLCFHLGIYQIAFPTARRIMCTLFINMCNKIQDPYSKSRMKTRYPEKGFLYFQLVSVETLCTDQVKLWKSEHYRLHRLSASTFGQGCFAPLVITLRATWLTYLNCL